MSPLTEFIEVELYCPTCGKYLGSQKHFLSADGKSYFTILGCPACDRRIWMTVMKEKCDVFEDIVEI